MTTNLKTLLQTKLIITTIMCLFGTTLANAETIYFSDTDAGPGTLLQMGEITITGSNFFTSSIGQPATVAGVGLGSALLGPIHTIDRQQSYAAGGGMNYSYLMEGISLSLGGRINSIGLTPYFSILGSSDSVFLPFDLSYRVYGTGGNWDSSIRYRTPASSDPLTLDFTGWGDLPSSIDFSLFADYGNGPQFYSYLSDHGFPETTFQFGYTIDWLDYTPLPEPSAGSLFGLGLLVLLYFKRRVNRSV